MGEAAAQDPGLTPWETFLCHWNEGPHHGVYRCLAHARMERWRYGQLKAWCTFEVYDAFKEI